MAEAPAPELSGSVGALSAALLGAALDVAGLAVIITDAPLDPPGPVIRYANAHFEAVTGYPAAEVIGRTPRMLQGPETDRAELHRLRQELEKTRHFIGAAVNYRKDGSSYLNEWVVLPILGLGRPLGETVTHWLSIQRDVSREGGPHPGAPALRARTAALLETVRAIAARTLTVPEEGRAFGSRLATLGRAQALAGAGGTDFPALLRAVLGPNSAGTTLQGPPVTLPPGTAEPLALALHELAAQSGEDVTVTWHIEEGLRLRLDWRARNAQASAQAWPMIEEALAFALGAETRLRHEGDHLHCTLAIPLGA
ncbi:PAS domain S-box-containing protein [Roseomonas rosea]|uniref:PAS domain S-box-containing protein n=1 Tax=Muricoccus roseus TaxID=198092 RepID=A0A1M6FHE5_9PROT|nr:PAS domain-containing protein [Roseomonas rosea]SHI97171.1 PAS domain S-box-containing protein [Roseomonas rosea]